MDSLIACRNAAGARYLLIGGQALRLHGLPRFSMDWDIFVPPHDAANLAAITDALGDEADVPLAALGPRGENLIQTYQTRFGVIQFHLAVPGLTSFDAAAARAVYLEDDPGQRAACLSVRDLLACKRASNRPQDQQDILFLEERLRVASPESGGEASAPR